MIVMNGFHIIVWVTACSAMREAVFPDSQKAASKRETAFRTNTVIYL